MQLHKFLRVILICGVIVVCGYPLAVGDIPHLVNYQGRLTDNGGNPLDGSYDLTFKIYNAATGGTLLWSEVRPSVPVSNGIFSIILGEVASLDLAFDTQYWLEVMVGAETIAPRRKLTSVGYAFRAQVADTAEHVINSGVASDTAKYAWNADSLDGHNWGDTYPNADKVDNYHAGNSSGQVPVSNGTLCSDLNADRMDGYHAGTSSGQIPVSNGSLCSNLNSDKWDNHNWGDAYPNADKVDNYHAGNSSGQVAVSNGSLCNNLNADKLDGKQASEFVDLSSTQTVGGSKTFTEDLETQDDVWAGGDQAVLGYDNTYGHGYCVTYTPNGNRLNLVSYLNGTNGLNGGVWIYNDGSTRGYYYVDTDNSSVLALTNSGGSSTIYLEGSTGTIYKNTCSFRTTHPLHANKDITYCALEGPEAAAYTRGTGILINGKAHIDFPDHFSLIISRNTITVQLTPLSAGSRGLAVTHKDSTGFAVEELNNGTGNYEFDYLVQGVRKGYEDYEVVREKLAPKDGALEADEQR